MTQLTDMLTGKLASLRTDRARYADEIERMQNTLHEADDLIGAIETVLELIDEEKVETPIPERPAPPPRPTPIYSPAVPPAPAPKRAPRTEADEFRDVIVPPHTSTADRPIRQLLEELADIIPAVGDTVRVAEFCRTKNEQQNLRSKIDRYNGDARFAWLRGIAGGARPARIERVKP